MFRHYAILGLAGIFLAAASSPAAKPKPKTKTKTVEVARSVSPLFRKAGPDKPWHLVAPDQALNDGDRILGGRGVKLESKNRNVVLTQLTDLEGTSPLPIKECVIFLHANPKVDVDVTLDRGRVDLTNNRKEGEATARVRVRDDVFEVTLVKPESRVAFELFSRWPKGTPFTKNPGPEDVPVAEMFILVVNGEVDLKHELHQFALAAPPGPAMMHWDSVTGHDESPVRLEKLPEWATAPDHPSAEALADLDRFRNLVKEKTLPVALEDMLNSDSEKQRRFAINAMGGLDLLPLLGKAMMTAKHPDVLDNGVLALRRWIGRGPGQDIKLYNLLVDQYKFSPGHADIFMQLLHSFGDDDLSRPETYEILVAYLDHEKPGIRYLAHWHLVRLVPQGKSIPYKALESVEARKEAVDAWKKLIPTGQLPKKP